MKSIYKISIDILNLESLFNSMINLDMFIDFMPMILKNHMFNMHLSKIFKNENNSFSTFQDVQTLQNKKN
jgi:hypothetical protein